MKDKKSILILYSKGIYDTDALTLAEAIRAKSDDCYVIDIADEKYTNFGRAKSARRLYKFSMRNVRWAYSLFSNMTAKKKAPNKELKNIKADPTERTGYNKFVYDMTCRYYKVKNILRRYEPDIVLCFTPSALKSAIKANEQLRMYTTKIYACLTDFGLDMRFYNRRAAGYLVQNDEIKRKLVSNGIDESIIHVTKLITRPTKEYDRVEIKREIGIRNDKPNVLLLGGRYGASIVKFALSTMVNYTDNFNIIVLTGGSQTIVNVARCVAKNESDSVFVIDKIDDIAKVYNLADIVVCTPTTDICGEVLSYRKPLVLLKGSGTMENANFKYLLSHGYAYDGGKKNGIMLAISEILKGNGTMDMSAYLELGNMDDVVDFMLDKAGSIFEEKKIILAEEKLKNSEEEDEFIIEEIDTSDNDADVEEVDTSESGADIEEIDTNYDDGANIEEYNGDEEI